MTPATRRWADVMIAMLGVALIVAGAVAVFAVEAEAGAAALLATGLVLLVVVALGDRIVAVRGGGFELELRRHADAADEAGDVELGAMLRAAADGMAARAARVAGSYEAVRAAMPSGPERTRAMEAEVARAREDAREGEFTGEQVAQLFRTGGEGQRIYALGVLRERPDLAEPALVLDAVRTWRTPFEHYHSLRVAEEAMDRLSPAERAALAAAVAHVLDARDVRRDGDRVAVARRILARLGQPAG